MIKKSLTIGLPMLALVALAGCVDSSYDLRDIDTETTLKVNDLVIPLNLKPVLLDKVIDIDDDDEDATIVKWPKEPAAGESQYYAVRKKGDFHSDPNTIERVVTDKPDHLESTQQTVTGQSVNLEAPARRAPMLAMKYVINSQNTNFEYSADNIDDAIQLLEKVKMQKGHYIITDISLKSPDVAQTAERVKFQNLALYMPIGMAASCDIAGVTYNAKEETINGEVHNLLRLPDIEEQGNIIGVKIVTDQYDFSKDPQRAQAGGIKVENGHMDFKAEIGVHSGELIVYPKTNFSVSDLPTSMSFEIDYDMSGFVIDQFSGKIQYDANIADIDPIDLSDLPDFLAGSGTNITILNPEISLDVNNPLAANQLSCKSGLRIIPVRDDIDGDECALPGDFTIGYNKGQGPYEYILAPNPDKAANTLGYANPDKIVYPTLGKILAGNGLPQSLKIQLQSEDTPVPVLYGDAQNFQLGEEINSIDGNYCFFTPLALAKKSSIVYDTTTDSFGSDDLDKFTIKTLGISAIATTELPCNVTIKITPLDKFDNIITLGEGSITETIIYGSDSPIQDGKIELLFVGDPAKGYIKDIDKLTIVAIADFEGDNTLAPDQDIIIKDIRFKVSGEYTFNLDDDDESESDDEYEYDY